MTINKTSDTDLNRIYEELLHRIQLIGIAISRQKCNLKSPRRCYDLMRTDTPSKDEAVDAFFQWNCAILTSFRGRKELSPEDNFNLNVANNTKLKFNMLNDRLMFRPVNGCYKEAHWKKESTEICFFVTNSGKLDDESTLEDRRKNFFFKMYRHAEAWEQDSFLFTFPGANRVAFLVATNEDGRKEFHGDIKFAGPLYELKDNEFGDWTEFSGGRLSFRLMGMLLVGTGNKKIKIGEGNIFDVDSYNADGIIVIRKDSQKGLGESCKHNADNILIVQHVFKKENQTEESIERVVLDCLNKLLKKKCKCIGFHCSATIDGSTVVAAKVAYETVIAWANRNAKKLDSVVIADLFGDYGKVIN